MKKKLKWSLWILLLIVIVVAVFLVNQHHNQRAFKGFEISITYNSTDTFLTVSDIKEYLNKLGFKKEGQPISEINTVEIEAQIAQNPYVAHTEVYDKMDGTVIINIQQSNPIVRVINMNGTHYYLDETGRRMPLNKHYTSHVPIANGYIPTGYEPDPAINPKDTGTFPRDSLLHKIYLIAKQISKDDFLKAMIEQIYVNEKNEFELVPKVGDQMILFGDAVNIEDKFENLIYFYRDGMKRKGWDAYSIINLKYKNQVICTKS